jgi:curved DNA-binding protein CbpA
MQQLNRAYAVLRNPEGRRAYDAKRGRGEATSTRRRNAASPQRQVEKCAGGTPNREGAVSPQ